MGKYLFGGLPVRIYPENDRFDLEGSIENSDPRFELSMVDLLYGVEKI